MFIDGLGAVFFGILIGWMAYRILRLKAGFPGRSEIIAILGMVVGAAALAIVKNDVFGWYSLGLVIGFFAYLAVGVVLYGKEEVQFWRLERIQSTSTPDAQIGISDAQIGISDTQIGSSDTQTGTSKD